MPEDHERSGDNGRGPAANQGRRFEKVRDLLPSRREGGDRITEDHILWMLAARRGREETFGRELFTDPAWDVLLELYAAKLGARTIALPALARSIDLPVSTTSRWVSALMQRRWVSWSGSDQDLVELSNEGAAAMERLMHHWRTAFRSI